MVKAQVVMECMGTVGPLPMLVYLELDRQRVLVFVDMGAVLGLLIPVIMVELGYLGAANLFPVRLIPEFLERVSMVCRGLVLELSFMGRVMMAMEYMAKVS